MAFRDPVKLVSSVICNSTMKAPCTEGSASRACRWSFVVRPHFLRLSSNRRKDKSHQKARSNVELENCHVEIARQAVYVFSEKETGIIVDELLDTRSQMRAFNVFFRRGYRAVTSPLAAYVS